MVIVYLSYTCQHTTYSFPYMPGGWKIGYKTMSDDEVKLFNTQTHTYCIQYKDTPYLLSNIQHSNVLINPALELRHSEYKNQFQNRHDWYKVVSFEDNEWDNIHPHST